MSRPPSDLQGLGDREKSPCDALGQRLAVDELHDEVGHAVSFPGLVHRDDRGMIEQRGHFRFATECPTSLGVRGDGLVEDLQCNEASQELVAGLPDRRRSSLTELRLDGEAVQSLANHARPRLVQKIASPTVPLGQIR
jgi:hypothetical protein